MEGSPSESQTSSTLEPEMPQHDRLATCVIAQQYPSATAASLRSHCRKEK